MIIQTKFVKFVALVMGLRLAPDELGLILDYITNLSIFMDLVD